MDLFFRGGQKAPGTMVFSHCGHSDLRVNEEGWGLSDHTNLSKLTLPI